MTILGFPMVEFPELQNDLMIRAARGTAGCAELAGAWIDWQ
jgi:hypothetical protein